MRHDFIPPAEIRIVRMFLRSFQPSGDGPNLDFSHNQFSFTSTDSVRWQPDTPVIPATGDVNADSRAKDEFSTAPL
jgi:hypothetical protein